VANFSVKWVDDNGDTVQSDSLPITGLTSSWQKVSADITAPADAVRVFITITSSSGHVGDIVYFDDIVIGDRTP
jgi:hypothetical protein